ncbi:MAG: hypothetical protein QM817_36770 [Archangium sp.]
MRRCLVVLLVLVLAPGCSTIRSRDLTPTQDAPRIQGDSFYRGDSEELDEQEYYQLVGDKESYDAIRNPRLGAQNTQFIWTILAIVGASAAAFGAVQVGLSQLENPPIAPLFPKPEDGSLNLIPYAITAGGAALFGVGVGLLASSGRRVNPEERKFDLVHARESARKAGIDPDAPAPNSYEGQQLAMEKQLAVQRAAYDEERKKLKRSDTRSLELSGVPETFAFGPGGKLKVEFLDEKGARLDFISTDDWLEFSSTPAGFIDQDGNWTNPLRTDLKYLGTSLTLTVALKESNLKASVTLKQDLGQRGSIGIGSPGSDGRSGESGRYGDDGRNNSPRGQNGAHGQHGTDGEDGGEVRAEAAFIQDQRGESYLLVISSASNWDITDAKRAVISVSGTRGGDGGRGGSGGRGWGPYKDCEIPGDGGDGGDGGNGGNGGDGPTLIVDAPSQAVLDQLELESLGGAGGDGGSSGSPGYAGNSQRCSYTREYAKAKAGRSGRPGQAGHGGGKGKTDTNVVAKSDLEWVNAWLKANPSMRYDDDGLDADEVPAGKKKKGKKR